MGAGGAMDDKALVLNVMAWVANVTTSVVTIFVIKALLTFYAFYFATTASGLHFLCSVFAVWAAERLGYVTTADMPLGDALLFAVVGAASISTANLSLLLNSVGFYQIAKLLMAPFVCCVEVFWLGKHFPASVLLSILVVLTGVAVVTVSDVTVKPLGLCMAASFVVTGGMQQVLCGHLQKKHALTSHQLMSNTSFLQGMMLIVTGPFIDWWVTHKWLLEWEANVPGLQMLAASCVLAVGVNVTQFLVLGRFSATSFQVLGHVKTLLVLMGGWLLFDEPMNPRKVAGMALAVSGMVSYGYFASRPTKPTIVSLDEATRLLPRPSDDEAGLMGRKSGAGELLQGRTNSTSVSARP